jgi:penicillin-insensitive murein DD-endopeptidase
MRARSFILATGMLVGGAAIAWPDDVLPLAARLVAPLIANTTSLEPAAEEDNAEVNLPAFAPAGDKLTFPNNFGAAVPAVSADSPPSAPKAGTDPGTGGGTLALAPSEPQAQPAQGAVTGTPAPVAAVDPAATGTPAHVMPVVPDAAAPAEAKVEPVQPVAIPAKMLFGAAKGPSLLQARAIGSYSRGCLAGAIALPVDGPAWQAMRLSRNRNWGHPKLVKLVEKLATTAQKEDSWPGLLVGDISQPRGGPMLTGHASHQLGLDADVWLTPMPSRTLTRKEREEISATSMLDKTDLAVDPAVFTEKHVKLIKRAASFPEVERVLVHPAIKKALCQAAGTDRGWLGKVRPIQGHYYHFHIRIGCPAGSAGCAPQKPTTGEDGCAKEVDEWLARLAPSKTPPPPRPPGWKPPPPKPEIAITQLPPDCRMVLESGADGVTVPPEALIPAAPKRNSKIAGRKGKLVKEPLLKATLTLRPAKDRRASQ